MSITGEGDLEDLGNEALLFAYGQNVNLYEDVFHIAKNSSIQEIWITYRGMLKEIEIALNSNAFNMNFNDQDYMARQYAESLGMKECHFAVGVRPKDFLDIKADALKRAYGILSNKKSRKEYDDCLRQYLECCENGTALQLQERDDESTRASLISYEPDEASDIYSYEGDDSLFDVSSIQAESGLKVDSFPLLSSQYHKSEAFDPFNLQDDLSTQDSHKENDYMPTKYSRRTGNGLHSFKNPANPTSPDDINMRLSASFTGMHPHGHETSVKICALPTSCDSSHESSATSEYRDLLHNYQRFESNSEMSGRRKNVSFRLPSTLSQDEEEELVNFQALSKSFSSVAEEKRKLHVLSDDVECFAMNDKQKRFFDQMDANLEDVECFSDANSFVENDDDSDLHDDEDSLIEQIDSESVDNDDGDNMSISSATKGKEVDTYKESLSVLVCLDACVDEFDQMCGVSKDVE